MGQIIIVEDNQGLLSVLSNGLKKYANIEPFPREDAQDAIDLLKIIPGIELIITKNKIGTEETAKILSAYISQAGLHTRLIVNGKMEKDLPPPHFIVANEGDFEQILYDSFKVLNIPLEEVRKKIVREYIPIKTKLFSHLDFIPCDTFLKLRKPGGKDYYLRCFHQGDTDKASPVESYISQNVGNLFILKDDEVPFHNVLADRITQILEVPKIPLKRRLDTMSDAFEVFSGLAVKWGLISCVSQNYDDLISSARTVFEMHHFVPLVYEQIKKENYSYNFKNFMNLSGAFFLLGKHNFMELAKDVEKLMGVALFHDVRLKEDQGSIFSLAELKQKKLSGLEEEIVLDHARDAAEILQGEKDYPMDMGKIIREHHGDISGLGFPWPPKESIGHLSKVFVATERFFKELYETKDAPDLTKILKTLDEDLYKKIIERLYFIFSGGK